MVDAVKRAGGDVKLTVYPDVQHNSWKATYDNPEVYDWLLAHRRAKYVAACVAVSESLRTLRSQPARVLRASLYSTAALR